MPYILTPITKTSMEDYVRESAHFGQDSNFNPQWDDTKHNNAQHGDYFVFVDAKQDRAQVFRIVGILPAQQRRTEWNMEEHQNRRVLVLSKLEETTTWTQIKERCGYADNYTLRGTMRCARV